MNEQLLNDKLKRRVRLSIVAGSVVIVVTALVILIMQRSLSGIVEANMETEAYEYKRRIVRQLDKDFRAVETLASVFSHGDMTEESWFNQCLYDASKESDSAVIAFFRQDGTGTLTTKEKLQKNVHYRSLNVNTHNSIRKALGGEENISKLFYSSNVGDMIFIYCVPVYNGEAVVGALTVGYKIDTFNHIITDERRGGGVKRNAIHLVNAQGNVLLSNSSMKHEEAGKDIFRRDDLFTEEEQERIEAAIEAGKPVHTHIRYIGTRYKMYLTPIGINNWFIMDISTEKGISQELVRMVNIMGVAFLALLGVILLLLAYICRQIARNNRSLIRMAYQDRLTGAENLPRFVQRLEKIRRSGTEFSLVALNIQQFKFVNEIFGVTAADELLCMISEELGHAVKDKEFYCRDSGDCFYLCLFETDREVIRTRIEETLDAIRARGMEGHMDYNIRFYAGVLICRSGEEMLSSCELLITRVRFAMKSARKMPTESIHFYDAKIHRNEEMSNFVETHMEQALENGEFKLFLQPKVRMKDSNLGGAEALVRWVTEDGRMIFPDLFIPQFEQNGFCVRLDLYMVEQVCRLIRSWMDAGIEPIPISVNQTKLLFFDTGYLDNLREILERYEIPPSLITLEILEGLALDHADEINTKLKDLRKMGFRISMDDFGSGYSSFYALGNLEIDELKLDRSLLLEASAAEGKRFSMIMEHIVNLTKSMEITTVAEGVETAENEELIRSIGCDFGQGYLYSRPVSAQQFSESYMNAEKEAEK